MNGLRARLLLYGAAIALIGVWFHQRQAAADGERPFRPVAITHREGRTAQGSLLSAWLTDGRLRWFTTSVDLTCPADRPELRGLWVDVAHVVGPAPADVLDGARLRGRRAGVALDWRDGWRGTAATRVDGTFTRTGPRGTLWAQVLVRHAGRPAALCRSGAVRFGPAPAARAGTVKTAAAPAPVPTSDGVTAGGAIREGESYDGATSDGGHGTAWREGWGAAARLTSLRVRHRLTCTSPSGAARRARGPFWWRQTTFVLGADGRLRAAAPAGTRYRWVGHPRATAAMRLTARLTDARLRGRLTVAVRPRGGDGPASCHADVRFTLRTARDRR